jgi:hypothetical protein
MTSKTEAQDPEQPAQTGYVWFWRKFLGERKGQPCRRICQGRNGNVLVEFADGFRVVAPRYATRRAA